MDTHLHTSGRTTWEMSMRLPREREANKATLSCLFYSALGNIGPLNRSVEGCVQERKSWRTLTMSTWYALLPGSEQSHRSWKRNCSVTPTSASITGKPKCGTVVDPVGSWNSRAHLLVDPTAVVWKSDPRLPPNERGLRVLGCPIGSPEVCGSEVECQPIFRRGMGVVVPLCTRAIFWLRNVQPAQTFWCAQQHDDNVRACFSRLTGFSCESPGARMTSSVPLGKGGLGLLSVGWHGEQPVVPQPFEGVCSLWSTWVLSHRSGSPCSSMPDLSWKRRRTQRSRRLVGRRKGYHKSSNIICRLSSGRPCLNLGGPSGVRIRVHWLLRSSWLCPHQDHQN